ncbi:RNA polymerase sigma-70 factor (ECF subfamily) [Actinoplanes octamycinicus]|uniref:RNA polymerase sigma-70 factor (ECF subfamily) n=1 Tax=Actinoplanes octamycinicus TaxID=135948 RepID=A0A7W7H1G8_9ACTN|nr:RNA polymerase sigma factor SigJ [Actinoplanes octamycinicus]MBB4742137.1 RNA polymerase sigma-70 factor (ECF subfamily) [Actinoplanes octamycinicus]GIE60017.1 DNA-directed RNA polymerase sigma-70 factor [Actinoplanes octamycinicus]
MLVGAHDVEVFERARPRLEAIAYRLLGSANDAEDAVQDTFLRWQAAERELIETPEAWLTKVLTNLCLNRLTSARARRETYVGQWLPEPVFAGDRMLGPSDTVEQRESVSLAMLTLMERLSARERVVYVLREAFGYPHAEIAEVLDLTESNCQQIHRRARQHLADERRRVPVDAAAARRIVEEFLAAALSGRTDSLVRMLTDDAISIGDGGGVVFSVPHPITGALRVARFLRTLFTPSAAKWEMIGGRPDLFAAVANGVPALVMVVGDRVAGVFALDVTTDGIAGVHAQANPGKLRHATRQWAAAAPGEPLTW